ncbi:ankyrin repeat-containing protein At5g02620-like [Impatiens glandulifera]|uniref:ankyrin repeat-containing protein At5g02620-like n=1 Tax=Impatiens glandulifera TaxID=253017 RepID=UPI001FB04FC4|nr:ankyrin repeat-containing protein At5g02620-like [Impatiens glandulifera]
MMMMMGSNSNSKKKTITKQLTRKKDDTPLHSAAREGNLQAVVQILSDSCESDEFLSMKNQSGETVLYVAAESGHVDLVTELIKYYDASTAGVKARNGYDPFHIAAKQGDLGIVKVLMDAFPELSLTSDQLNTTALHTAAAQGHVEIVNFLLEKNSGLATIAKSNSKTALHSSARNGHLDVVKALLRNEPGMATRVDKKGQTALHMAVKGLNDELVDVLLSSDCSLLQMVDGKGNIPLHIAARKGRNLIVRSLLKHESGVENRNIINKSGETALDTAQKVGNSEIAKILIENGVQHANSLKPNPTITPRARELKQTVSDIKHEVHDQLEHTRQTRRRVHGIARRLNKMHEEGLNNAINSTTVVAVLIATVAFAAIFSVPGQYEDDPRSVPKGYSVGEARIGQRVPFTIFFIFDSFALFISLAVVVVQTSVVAVERKAKKQMMFFINKLMWLACAFISVAYLSLCYVVVGDNEKWFAVVVMVVGTVIMLVTFGTMSYWVIRHRIDASNLRNVRRSSRNSSRLQSWSASVMSDSEILNKVYAI